MGSMFNLAGGDFSSSTIIGTPAALSVADGGMQAIEAMSPTGPGTSPVVSQVSQEIVR